MNRAQRRERQADILAVARAKHEEDRRDRRRLRGKRKHPGKHGHAPRKEPTQMVEDVAEMGTSIGRRLRSSLVPIIASTLGLARVMRKERLKPEFAKNDPWGGKSSEDDF